MRSRKQNGTIIRIGDRWFVRYWERQNIGGTIERKRVSHLLGPITTRGQHPPADIVSEAERHMMTVNNCEIPAENRVTLAQFIETIYLPDVEKYKRPATFKGYSDVWRYHLRPALKGNSSALKSWRTVQVQNLLDRIAREAQEPLGRNSLKRIKSQLSAIFGLAKRFGFFDGMNPATDTKIDPHATPPGETPVYSFEDAQAFLSVIPEPAATAVAVAAFTGLREGEISGLHWEDYRDGALHVARSIWKGHESPPKTRKSAAAVPVISQLATRLALHRGREMARLHRSDLQAGPMFTNTKGDRLDFDNLVGRFILPAVNRCATCGKGVGKLHRKQDHDFVRDTSIPEWHGWHGFRRGVGTNLHELGVSDIGVQKILRHSDVATTQAYYIKPDEQSKRDSMAKLEAEVADKMSLGSLRDTDRTPYRTVAAPPETVN
jgi:integrase